MPTSLIVVDDFFDNAHQLRDAALKLHYPDIKGVFPGRNSAERLEIQGLTGEVSRLVGEQLVPLPHPQSHGKFRITLADDVGQAKVHVDAAHWSGILYLSRSEDCRGGTEFFRHRRTGLDHAPFDDAEAIRHGYDSAKSMTTRLLDEEGTQDDQWEMTMRVPMRFNRLVLLRPWLWHTAGEAFGDSRENGRLVYLMFFGAA